MDYDGNEVLSAEFAITLSFGARPGYREGFETDAAGWSFSGDWAFGAPVEGWDPSAFEGDQVAATVLGGPHSEQNKSWLISPPLDLRDDSPGEASLRFQHWYSTYDRYAYGQVMVSADNGGSWQTVSPKYFGMDQQWREYAVDLSAYVGSPDPVYVAFYFEADTWATMEGWYIDDVRLMGEDTEAPAAPQELTASTVLGGVTLNWWPSPEGDVTHYEVYRSEDSGGPWTLLAEPAGARYLDTAAPRNVTQYYRVRALVFSGNASDYSNEAPATAKPYVPLFGSDFEADDGGMVKGTVSGENDWAWGIPESGPSRARSGEKLWGTNLTGDYVRNSSYFIETSAIELPLGSEPILSFSHWFETEGDEFYAADFGTVEISEDDGRTWTNITPDPGVYAGRVRQWLQAEIPLAGHEGSTVKIRFLFTTDGGIEYYGWYVDDVYVMGIDEEPAPAVKVQPEVRAASMTLKMESPLTETAKADPQYPTMTLQEIAAIPTEISGTPAQGATVTVLETGRTVSTDPATGVYSMRMRTGEYTLVAESYGYEPAEATVTIEEDETVSQSFFLDPSSRGSITGRVVDRYYGDPAAFAEIRLLEDPNVAQVTADAEGEFTIPDVLVGDYTLRVTADGFESAEFPVSVTADEVTEVELGLKRFVGYGGEIIYDDGSAEDALVLFQPPNGVAVRFTSEQSSKVQGVNIFLWDESFPIPGGNRLGFNVYGIDESGLPYPAGEPIYRDDLVRGEWNYIDLSSLGFSTEGDFFISTVQDQPGELGPAVGLDYDSPYGDRSFLNIGGEFIPLADEGFPGGFMLRAIVMNTVSTPVFTNLTDVNYTNQDVITVEGAVDYDGIVNLYLNGAKEVTVVSEGGVFTAEVPVPLTENTLMATAELDGVETEPSAEVLIIKDQTAPELEVFSPEDGLRTNSEAIHVTGSAADEYLSEVLVNGEPVAVTENGDFDQRIFVEPGENLITIEARDMAGNVTQIERTVIVRTDGLIIRDLKPAVDLEVEAGDEVTFSFRSATTGGEASYAILLPIGTASVTRTAMTEEEPGFYTATWTVPAMLRFRDARVSFELLDGHGNRLEAVAPGTISIGITPIERIAGASRYLTSVEASRQAFKSADTVILASGESFPDALTAAPLAGAYQAPILLTQKDRVSLAVLNEIRRLGAERILILGGESVISDAVETQLTDYEVERIVGASRFETAAAIGDLVTEATGSKSAILINGFKFADGLSVGPAAALKGSPILFTASEVLPAATLAALEEWGIEDVTIIGGTAAVSENIAVKLRTAGYEVNRISGRTRYDTALAVARTLFDSPDHAVIASGLNFPDAMAGAPIGFRYNAPVLLVQKDHVSQDLLDYLEETGIRKAFILGGSLVISETVVSTIENVIR